MLFIKMEKLCKGKGGAGMCVGSGKGRLGEGEVKFMKTN